VENDKWIAFLCFYGKTPLELYTSLGDEEIFPIPESIIKGIILKTSDKTGRMRIDFQYTDKYGYKKTIEGVNHVFLKQISTYNSIINKLLRTEMPIKEIISVINEMDIHDIITPDDWKKGIIKALKESNG
jgi:hypothetical protein